MSQVVEMSIRTIDWVKRLNNSVNGNPRYQVTFTDGSSAITKSDSSCAYDIQNIMSRNNLWMRNVAITWTKAGRIETITPRV
jgi:hypothetical protein